jgi:hypothetical protein
MTVFNPSPRKARLHSMKWTEVPKYILLHHTSKFDHPMREEEDENGKIRGFDTYLSSTA